MVLFAALSYAVTQSMRGGGKDASDEQAKALAAALIQQGALFANTATRLRLINDCKDTQLSFENSVDTGYANINAPVSKKCHFFDPAGGGATPENFETYSVAAPTGWDPLWGHPGYFEPWIYIWPYAGTSKPDVIFTTMAIKPPICNELATELGQPYRPSISGTSMHAAYNAADWDTATAVFTGTTQQHNYFATHDTVVLAEEGSGSGAFRHVLHLVMRR